MRFDRLTTSFQSAFAEAQSLALGQDQQFIEPVHLLSALLKQPGGATHSLLLMAGVDVQQLQKALEQALQQLPQVQGVGGDVQPSQALIRLLNLCDKLAQQRGDQFIAS
jgi:ATP-dependent Clp protease ATP-binding subunit ClpB